MCNGRQFLVSWDQLGLESIFDLTEMQSELLPADQEKMWSILADKKPSQSFEGWLGNTLFNLELRAKANYHRHYEIYAFTADETIDKDYIVYMFDRNPQMMADLIRAKGHCVFSERARPEQIKIK